MRQDEYFEMMVSVGRVPFKVDLAANIYDDSTDDDDESKDSTRHPATLEESNCWSSYSRLGRSEGWHLPVFDVDHLPSDRATPSDMPIGGLAEHLAVERFPFGRTNEEVVRMAFPEVEPRWVSSFSPGHFHVYVDYPYQWDDYLDRIKALFNLGIIEDGYGSASAYRGATFVRMPGVPKHEVVECPSCNKRAEKVVQKETMTWQCPHCGVTMDLVVLAASDQNY